MKLMLFATNGQNAIVVHDMITMNSAHQKPSNINSMLLARGETEKFNALIERKSRK